MEDTKSLINPQEDHVIINVWTAEDSIISGHNVGHVSVQTNYMYMSLWPAKHIKPKPTNQIEKFLNRYFAPRVTSYKTCYLEDAICESLSEGENYCREINSLHQLKNHEIAVKLSESGDLHMLDSNPNQQIQLEEGEFLLAIKPIEANIRIVLYGLDVGKIHQCFNELKMKITGWSLAGSNMLTRNLKLETQENCASLAYRLLQAGGMYVNLNSVLSSQNSSVVTPEKMLTQVVAAKEKELISEKLKTSKNWQVTENRQNQTVTVKETPVEEIKKLYKEARQTANAEKKMIPNVFRKEEKEDEQKESFCVLN